MKTISQIAQEQEVSPNTVRAWLRKAGIKPQTPGFDKPGKGRMYLISTEQEKTIIKYKEVRHENR